MSVTVTDEVYDESGTVVASSQRQIEAPFTRAQYLQARRQVRQVLEATGTPTWGKALARFLLMTAYLERDDEPVEG
jgi:hypothetical protein